MIHVIATITARPGRRDELLAEFRRILGPVRAEDGCIESGTAVDATTDLPAQPPPRPDVVTVVEKGEGLDHLRRHLAAPRMEAFRERVGGIVEGIALTVLDPA